MTATTLPQLEGTRLVTDGGLETDLIFHHFHHGFALPDFAAFPLLDDVDGRAALTTYYDGYAAIAAEAGAGLLLESPTWRASTDWGARLGYDADALHRVNGAAIAFLRDLAARYRSVHPGIGPVLMSGMLGPRGDGYVVGERMGIDEATRYHRPQLAAFAEAGADLASAATLTTADEAIGVVLAAREVGIRIAVSFTVETDGRLPDGTALDAAITRVDAAAAPDYFGVNCAYPDHVGAGLAEGTWRDRIRSCRPNASQRSHAELDAADDLDEGAPAALAAAEARLDAALGGVTVLGGCCGTDARHVRALWGLPVV